MNVNEKPWKDSKNGIVLQVRLVPRAVKTAILQIKPEYVKIAIQAPPVEGRANTALIAFLADSFSVSKASITIKSGTTGRNKVVEITGISEKDAENVLKH